MSRLLNQPADIAALLRMRLDDDIRQQAAEYVLRGKPLSTAIRHARAQVCRDNRPCGRESIDAASDGEPSMHDLIAAADPAEVLEYRSRWEELDAQSEAVLDLMQQGTRCIAATVGLTQRRIQQIFKAHIDRVAAENKFMDGGKGQGGLFGFDDVEVM